MINYNEITSPASNDGDDDEEFASSTCIGSVIQLSTNIYHIFRVHINILLDAKTVLFCTAMPSKQSMIALNNIKDSHHISKRSCKFYMPSDFG